MTQPSPRTYWCHIDHDCRRPTGGPREDITTAAPGQAVEWVRESVRAISPTLGRETFTVPEPSGGPE